jgi:hypothetical protein
MKCGMHPKRSWVSVLFTDGSRSWMKLTPGCAVVKGKKEGSSFISCSTEKDTKNHEAWEAKKKAS